MARDASSPLPSVPSRSSGPPTLSRAHRGVTTVLIADLVGYSALAERLDPEDLDRIMRRLLEGEHHIIRERYDGIVFGSDGDDVKALFGARVVHEDDPRRAVRCAMELQAFARGVSAEFPELAGRPLVLHSAISTGVVVAMGSRGGGFGPTGDPINTAARLVHVAQPGEIVVEAVTKRDIELEFVTEPLGAVSLRGKHLPVDAFRVLHPIPRTWFEVPRARGLSPFVGRAFEQTILEDCLQGARHGRGRFVTVSGEPGVGKSRLLYELRQRIGDDVRVVLAECDAAPTAAPFDPFLRVARALLGIRDAEAPDTQRARVVAALADLDARLQAHLPLYLQLLSLPPGGMPVPPQLRDEQLREAILDALAALVTAATRRMPLLVLLEDWHLADEASRAVLARLVEAVSSHALVVVATYRSESVPPLDGTAPTVIHLHPLGIDDSRAVIASRLGEDTVSDDIVHRLHQHTGGNPLFLDEVCRSLREAGFTPRPDVTFEDVTVPSTVQAVIRARIDRLDPLHRRVLRLASVLGLTFPQRLLAMLLEEDEEVVGAALARLADYDMVVAAPVPPGAGRQYRFKHAITREVAYETLLREDRRQLHRRAGAAIESLYSGRLDEHDEILAAHYERGEELARAAFFAKRAGDKAAATFSLGPARVWYRRAIALLDARRDDPEAVQQRIDVSMRWAEVCVYDPAAVRDEVLQTSYELAERSGDLRRAARAVYWMGWFEHAYGNHHVAGRHFERALELGVAVDDQRLIRHIHANLGQSAYHRGELALAAIRLARALAPMDRTIVTANALGYLALVDAERGDFGSAHARLREALEIVRALRLRQLEGSILTIVAFVDLFHGEWEACVRRAAEMRAIADAIGAPYILAMSKTADGYARWFGRGERDGLATMREAITELETSGSRLSMSVNYACLAEVLALTGEWDEARVMADRARQRVQAGDRVGEIQACRALGIGAARAASPHPEEARRCFGEGIELAETRGATREAAVTRWRFAEMLAAAGDRAGARAVLAPGARAFERSAMSWHREQAAALAHTLT